MRIFSQVRQLLIARGNSTISELKEDYETQICDGWLPESYKDITDLLKTIPDVVCRTNSYGLNMWTVRGQRPAKRERPSVSTNPPNVKRQKSQKVGHNHRRT